MYRRRRVRARVALHRAAPESEYGASPSFVIERMNRLIAVSRLRCAKPPRESVAQYTPWMTPGHARLPDTPWPSGCHRRATFPTYAASRRSHSSDPPRVWGHCPELFHAGAFRRSLFADRFDVDCDIHDVTHNPTPAEHFCCPTHAEIVAIDARLRDETGPRLGPLVDTIFPPRRFPGA